MQPRLRNIAVTFIAKCLKDEVTVDTGVFFFVKRNTNNLKLLVFMLGAELCPNISTMNDFLFTLVKALRSHGVDYSSSSSDRSRSKFLALVGEIFGILLCFFVLTEVVNI